MLRKDDALHLKQTKFIIDVYLLIWPTITKQLSL